MTGLRNTKCHVLQKSNNIVKKTILISNIVGEVCVSGLVRSLAKASPFLRIIPGYFHILACSSSWISDFAAWDGMPVVPVFDIVVSFGLYRPQQIT